MRFGKGLVVMQRLNNPNLMILELAVSALGPLADDMVFIGGCATGLLITDLAAPVVRVTKDVDVITEVASLVAYHQLSEQLHCCARQSDRLQFPSLAVHRQPSRGLP